MNFIKYWKYETREVVQHMNEGNSLLSSSLFPTSILVKNKQEPSWLSWTNRIALLRKHLQKGQWQLTHFIHLRVQHLSLIDSNMYFNIHKIY